MPIALLSSDPLASTLVLLVMLWLAAKLGGEAAIRLKLPAVAGQIAAGVLLAALPRIFGWFPVVDERGPAGVMEYIGGASAPADVLAFIESMRAPSEVLAYIGIVLLMFMVGLESSVPQMMKVGWASMRVAIVGVVGPMVLGLASAYFILHDSTFVVYLFIGACLCATSIGISVSVLRERNAADTQAGRVVIGAAVIDDVLGLLVLAAVSGIATASVGTGGINWVDLGSTLAFAFIFLTLALTAGRWLSPKLFAAVARLKGEEVMLPFAVAFAFFLAWLGYYFAGLATIVGAYSAGLILEHSHVDQLQKREGKSLEDMVKPIVAILAPLFFVLTGASVDTSALLEPRTLALAGVLTATGIIGKYISGYVAGRGLSTPVIGWGMVPRGEVGLIFVAVGRSININGLPLINAQVQAGVLGAILMTTIIGPIGLSWVLGRTKEVK